MEVLAHHRIDLGEIAQVGEEQARAHDLVQRTARGLAHGLEVVERAPRLHFDVAFDERPLSGSSGIWPDRYTVSPTRTACEYGPMAAGARSVWMMSRDMRILRIKEASYRAAHSCTGRGEAQIALHAQHDLEPAHAPHHFGQVLAVAHFDLEADRGDVGVAFDVFEPVDVRFGLGDRGGHLGQRTRTGCRARCASRSGNRR